MILNINQTSVKEQYISWMLDFVNTFDDTNYLGVISYVSDRTENPQPMWVWKKFPKAELVPQIIKSIQKQ